MTLPAPRPLCAAYGPLVRLLRSGGLETDECEAVEAHLADCAWCQHQLATYDLVDDALRRHYATGPLVSAGGAPPTPVPARKRVRPAQALDETSHIGQGENADEDDEDDDVGAEEWTARPLFSTVAGPLRTAKRATVYASLTPATRVAFVLVLALLAAGLFARLNLGETRASAQVASSSPSLTSSAPGISIPLPTPTPRAALDPQAQVYVDVLRTYYQPLYAELSSSGACEDAYLRAASSDRMNVLLGCRDAEAAVVVAAQTLSHHLAATTPPLRWETVHKDLMQAVQATIPAYQQRVAAIDGRSATRFDQALAQTHTTLLVRYCDPIAQINAELAVSNLLTAPAAACSAHSPAHGQPYAAARAWSAGPAGPRHQQVEHDSRSSPAGVPGASRWP